MYLKSTPVKEDTDDELFDRIGLTLSGGGYRAAAFHLGSMSYLHHLRHPVDNRPLLERVKFLSTISGGTITGAVYAAALVDHGNAAFPAAYATLHRFLREDRLLATSLERLRHPNSWPEWAAGKVPNLINAFALEYRELTGHRTFKELRELLEADGPSAPHLWEVAFGATDLRNALPFRFQNKGHLGNHYLRVPRRSENHLYLGDIIAASSAFPGGFEAIRFPDDFLAAPEAVGDLDKLRKSAAFREPVDLLDGGIVSNQGFDALEQFLNRSKKTENEGDNGESLTLLITSDVAGYYHPRSSTQPDPRESEDGLSLRASVLLLVGVVALVFILGLSRPIEWLLLLLPGMPAAWLPALSILLALLLVALTLRWLRGRLRTFIAELPAGPRHLLSAVRRAELLGLSTKRFVTLIRGRIQSLGYVVADVFLSRNRRRDTSQVFQALEEQRIVSNYIYTLAPDTGMKDALPLCREKLSPAFVDRLLENGLTLADLNGSALPALADRAARFGTISGLPTGRNARITFAF